MLVVNTTVVKALMVLRGLNPKTLSKVAGVREDNLRAWLSGSESADLCMARKNQILVLRALGVDEESPRSDTVHAWALDERSARTREQGVDALSVIVSAYDDAEVMHFGADEDSAFTLSQCSHFGLRFSNFRAVLTVRPGFFRDVKFSPDEVRGLAWADENPVCLLPAFRFEQISNADVTPTEFEDFTCGQVELSKWENLHLLAREHQIRAEDIAVWMFSEVSAREERLSIAHEQAKKHVLLEDATVVSVEPTPARVQAPAALVAPTYVREPVAPVPSPVATYEPSQPKPAISEKIQPATVAESEVVPAPVAASIPVAPADPAAAAVPPPVETIVAARTRPSAPSLRKAEVNNIDEHRMFVRRG